MSIWVEKFRPNPGKCSTLDQPEMDISEPNAVAFYLAHFLSFVIGYEKRKRSVQDSMENDSAAIHNLLAWICSDCASRRSCLHHPRNAKKS